VEVINDDDDESDSFTSKPPSMDSINDYNAIPTDDAGMGSSDHSDDDEEDEEEKNADQIVAVEENLPANDSVVSAIAANIALLSEPSNPTENEEDKDDSNQVEPEQAQVADTESIAAAAAVRSFAVQNIERLIPSLAGWKCFNYSSSTGLGGSKHICGCRSREVYKHLVAHLFVHLPCVSLLDLPAIEFDDFTKSHPLFPN